MAEDLKLRQKATQELFAQNSELLNGIPTGDQATLRAIADGFESELDSQGVPFYAEEAFTALTLIETVDADNAASLEDVQEALAALRLAMIQKITTAWADRDKSFFID